MLDKKTDNVGIWCTYITFIFIFLALFVVLMSVHEVLKWSKYYYFVTCAPLFLSLDVVTAMVALIVLKEGKMEGILLLI